MPRVDVENAKHARTQVERSHELGRTCEGHRPEPLRDATMTTGYVHGACVNVQRRQHEKTVHPKRCPPCNARCQLRGVGAREATIEDEQVGGRRDAEAYHSDGASATAGAHELGAVGSGLCKARSVPSVAACTSAAMPPVAQFDAHGKAGGAVGDDCAAHLQIASGADVPEPARALAGVAAAAAGDARLRWWRQRRKDAPDWGAVAISGGGWLVHWDCDHDALMGGEAAASAADTHDARSDGGAWSPLSGRCWSWLLLLLLHSQRRAHTVGTAVAVYVDRTRMG